VVFDVIVVLPQKTTISA